MKTKYVATSLMVVALVCALGCAKGSNGKAGVGSSANAWVVGPVYQDMNDGTTTQARSYVASCALRDAGTGRDMLLVIGGVIGPHTTTTSRDWFLFDPTVTSPSNQWVDHGTFGTLGTDERVYADAMSLWSGSVPTACLLVGGMHDWFTTSTTPDTFKFTYDSTATPKMTIASAGTLNAGRRGFALLPCGTNKAIVIGGENQSGVLTSNTIEVWDGSSTWTLASNGGVQSELGVKRSEFGASRSGTSDNYLIAGGKISGGRTGRLEAIKVGSSCSATSVAVTTFANSPGTTALNTPIEGNVLLESGPTGEFVSALGFDGSITPLGTELIDVNFTTPSITSIFTDARAPKPVGAGTHLPKVVRMPASITGLPETNILLIGGDDGFTHPHASVYEYKVAAGPKVGSFGGPVYLTTGDRRGAGAAWLPSQDGVVDTCGVNASHAYVVGGFRYDNFGTVASTEEYSVN